MIAPARQAAFDVLRAVSSGKVDLGTALAQARTRLGDERDRALAGEIATGTLRWQAAFDHVTTSFANRPLKKLDAEVIDILRLSMFQLLHLDRIPASAAVKDAVDLAGKAGKRSAAGLVNAVLRRVSRERASLPLPPRPANLGDRDAVLSYLSTTLSHPAWLVARWLDRYGFEAAETWARFNNSPAALTLRANRLKTTRHALREALAREGIESTEGRHAADALVIRAGNPLGTALDEEGAFVVQDEGSQLVGEYADAKPGETVLDACASPGGKTTQMATAMNGSGRIVAADVRGRRVRLLSRTIARCGAANVRIVQADAAGWLPFGAVFDRILLDAPCSGLGTLRRDPDIKWRRRETDLASLARVQLQMLEHAGAVLAPRGTLVYSTCSSEPEENDGVVSAFLASHPEFRLDREPLLTLPHRHGLEVFFAAMLVKTKDLR